MRINIRAAFAAVLLAFCGFASAAVLTKTFRSEHTYELENRIVLIVDNPVGNVEIYGYDGENVRATAAITIKAANEGALEDGRRNTKLIVDKDQRALVLRTNVAPNHSDDWDAKVDWRIRVPRTLHLRIVNQASDRIRVTNIRGNIYVKNTNGNVFIENATGQTLVESVNGSIVFNSTAVNANVGLSTVNGNVSASVPANAEFRWVAKTIRGDIRTNLPVRGAFFGPIYRAALNGPGGPQVTTATLMGNVMLLAVGSSAAKADSVRPNANPNLESVQASSDQRGTERNEVKGFFRYGTTIGDVRVQEIRGDAEIFTGAGEVQLGLVSGFLRVESHGGPLRFGDVGGSIDAVTNAGDISIDRAREGGTARTRGGTIRLLRNDGPIRLISGGGDIIVRDASAPVRSETDSGDITITIDPDSKSESVFARSGKGSVVLSVSSHFAADVEATILTGNPNADTIVSDIPGLSISRDQVGAKTRVRATGKINGGGQRVVLEATDGDIRISTKAAGIISPQ